MKAFKEFLAVLALLGFIFIFIGIISAIWIGVISFKISLSALIVFVICSYLFYVCDKTLKGEN